MDGQQAATADDAQPSSGDGAAVLTPTALATAWVVLPERWRAVLWHHDVEGRGPDEVAVLLGTSGRAVGALRERASAGLHRAVLGEHLRRTADHRCSTTLHALPALLDGSIGPARETVARRHLEDCSGCRTAHDDLLALRTDPAGTVLRAARGDAQPR